MPRGPTFGLGMRRSQSIRCLVPEPDALGVYAHFATQQARLHGAEDLKHTPKARVGQGISTAIEIDTLYDEYDCDCVMTAVKKGESMKKILIVVICALTCLMAQDAFAAIKFKRFPHCSVGLVTEKTCECHAGASGRFHYCHAGHYCHFDGTCHE